MTAKIASEVLQRRLAKALKIGGDTHTIEDIQQAIARGTMQCFVKDNSFAITEIINAPQKRFLNVFLIVGELNILELHDEVEAFAKQAGCDFMQAYGRPGWTPKIKSLGWEPDRIVFRRKIGLDK
jgi:hypothetical protein